MARIPAETDFNVPVEGIGTFTFGRRRFADEIAIQVEYARIIDGVTPTDWLSAVGGWLSALKVLTVRAPAGWSLDDLDPLDPAVYAKLNRVYEALKEKERSFRSGHGVGGQAGGAGDGQNSDVLVPPKVQSDPA